jgi:hypothetical protein
MWLPPTIQQLTNSPGNFGLIYRFFTSSQPGQTLGVGANAVTAVFGVLIVGPSEVMTSVLGQTPNHAGIALLALVVVVLIGIAVVALGVRQGNRFAFGLGILGLVGTLCMVFAATRVVGPVYGYLVMWSVVLPVGILIGLGMVRPPSRSTTAIGRTPLMSSTASRSALSVVAVVASVAFVIRVAAIPALGSVSSSQVEQLTSLVTPKLAAGGQVFVDDNGAGTAATTQLFDVFYFIGLVNRLDQEGFQPKVNATWRTQFGPGYLSTGHERRLVELTTWTPTATHESGYVGRVGDIAVTVTAVNRGPTGS